MTDHIATAGTMRTVRFHEYGEPGDVLRLERAPVPAPGPERIRISVRACGLNPADWALCRGLFPGQLPRGIGVDVAGEIDALGPGVSGVGVGDLVFGTADWANGASAGASEHAVMDRWTIVPEGLSAIEAAALPMASETAHRSLTQLGLKKGHTILIHGAGSAVGFAAVQIAIMRGARVLATAGGTHAPRLRDLGAKVTSYGEGMVQRVRALGDGPPDLVLDAAPPSGAMPDLVRIAGDPQRVLTISDFAAAAELGARDSFHEQGADPDMRFEASAEIRRAEASALLVDVLPEYAQLAAQGKFGIPIARTLPLEGWRTALELSLSGRPGGKLVLLPTAAQSEGVQPRPARLVVDPYRQAATDRLASPNLAQYSLDIGYLRAQLNHLGP
jgi:NADPH:quinone reductase-like Zn-dependent oxidoreductase